MASRDRVRTAVERAARAHFAARGLRERGVAFVQPLGDDVWFGATFVVGRDERPGHVVTPIVGVQWTPLHRLLASLSDREYTPEEGTLASPLDLAGHVAQYEVRSEQAAEPAMAAMVRDVVEVGLPAYAPYATPEAIVAAMPTFPVILSESGRFWMMPVGLHLLGRPDEAREWLLRGEEHFRPHMDPATGQYFVFARRLRALLVSSSPTPPSCTRDMALPLDLRLTLKG
jgi:hypothetical protein